MHKEIFSILKINKLGWGNYQGEGNKQEGLNFLEVPGHNYVTGIDEKGGIFVRRGAKS